MPSTFMLWTCSMPPPRITYPQHHWLKISDQPVEEETLLVIILLIHKRNPFIFARTSNCMSPNFLWTPIKSTVLSSIPNCSCASSSQQHEFAKNPLLSLLQTCIHGPIDLSLPSLNRWHWSACRILQMQYLRLFFSAAPIASGFTAKAHLLEHGLVWYNNHKTTCHFQ